MVPELVDLISAANCLTLIWVTQARHYGSHSGTAPMAGVWGSGSWSGWSGSSVGPDADSVRVSALVRHAVPPAPGDTSFSDACCFQAAQGWAHGHNSSSQYPMGAPCTTVRACPVLIPPWHA